MLETAIRGRADPLGPLLDHMKDGLEVGAKIHTLGIREEERRRIADLLRAGGILKTKLSAKYGGAFPQVILHF
jgi:hypothetical protein